MVFKCSVPGCNSNYKNDEGKYSVFSFPKDVVIHQKWLDAIPTKNFQSHKNSKICERHFEPWQISREASGYDPKTNRTITVPLTIPRLKAGAIPTIFAPHCSSNPKSELALIRRKKNQPKAEPKEETQTTVPKLFLADKIKLINSQNDCDSSIATKEKVQSTEESPLLVSPNVIYLNKKTHSSSSSTPISMSPSISKPTSSNLSPSMSSASANSEPSSISKPCSKNLSPSTSLPSSKLAYLDPSPEIESQDDTEPPVVIREETNKPLPHVIDNIIYVEELLPSPCSAAVSNNLSHSSSSSPPGNSPIIVRSFTFTENASPTANPDSTIVDETPIVKKFNRKRKMNELKPDASESSPNISKVKSRRCAKKSTYSNRNRSSVPHPSTETKKPGEGSSSSFEDSQNATREIFQSLLSGSEKNPLFGSGTMERNGDLFNMFSDFIADKLREMNSENCAFALRSILDIVLKTGEMNKNCDDAEDGDISNIEEKSRSSSDD